jgi:hypothetical protein
MVQPGHGLAKETTGARHTLESLAGSGREYFKTTGARLADIDKVGHQVRQVAPEETTFDSSADPILLGLQRRQSTQRAVSLRCGQLDLFASPFLGIIDLNLKHRKPSLEVFGCF